MRGPPPGFFYGAATLLLAVLAFNLRSHHDAPAVAPTPPEAQALEDVTLIDPFVLKTPPADVDRTVRGSAVSVSEGGAWLTLAPVIRNCASPMVMVTPLRGLVAQVVATGPHGLVVLRTRAGAPPLPIADRMIETGGRAFHPGYPRLAPGELTTRRLGAGELGVGDVGEPALAIYAETGRTDGLDGGAAGGLLTLAGAPVLDEAGRVTGLSIKEAARRGRILATSLSDIRRVLQAAHVDPSPLAEARAITVDNYGIVADTLRRNASLAAVICADPPKRAGLWAIFPRGISPQPAR